jgi:hypothetical protein
MGEPSNWSILPAIRYIWGVPVTSICHLHVKNSCINRIQSQNNTCSLWFLRETLPRRPSKMMGEGFRIYIHCNSVTNAISLYHSYNGTYASVCEGGRRMALLVTVRRTTAWRLYIWAPQNCFCKIIYKNSRFSLKLLPTEWEFRMLGYQLTGSIQQHVMKCYIKPSTWTDSWNGLSNRERTCNFELGMSEVSPGRCIGNCSKRISKAGARFRGSTGGKMGQRWHWTIIRLCVERGVPIITLFQTYLFNKHLYNSNDYMVLHTTTCFDPLSGSSSSCNLYT